MENNEGRSSSSKKKQQKGTAKATACLLTNTQKQKIRSSQCVRRNFAREAIEKSDQFIRHETRWPFIIDPTNVFVTQRLIWRYKRAVDLNMHHGQKIIGGRPINPHQFKFVVSYQKSVFIVHEKLIT